MRKHYVLLRLSGRRLVSFFLLAALLGVAHVSPLAAADKSDPGNQMNQSGTGMGKDDTGQVTVAPCDPGPPCVKHSPPSATDKYYPYGATNKCSTASGWACNFPGVGRCGINNAGTCHTLNTGGGVCACNCVMP
jgi:hypothetical protein